MNVAIVVFSPNGNTLKVAKMLENNLIDKYMSVQLIELTGNKIFSDVKTINNYLCENIHKHDLLLIGAPVYAHHFHYNIKNVIKSLPEIDSNWGKFAIPFVTYGGINSGIALYEAAKLLKKSGREVIAGMKINSFHCWTKRFNKKINEGMPGDEIKSIIDDLAERIENYKDSKEIINELNYQNLKVRLKAKILFREKFSHNIVYPKLKIEHDRCKNCGRCIKICPVQRLEFEENKRIKENKRINCIHCQMCTFECSHNAIDFKTDWSKWEKILNNAGEGNGPLPSKEFPLSCVYPIRNVK